MGRNNNKKNDNGENAKPVGYVVADGHAFTHDGVMYAAGDAINVSAFASDTDFHAAIKAGSIVANGKATDDIDANTNEGGESSNGDNNPSAGDNTNAENNTPTGDNAGGDNNPQTGGDANGDNNPPTGDQE